MTEEMILVIFNSSIEDEMMEALKQAGMKCYTKVVDVQGAGEHSNPRLDCHVWPGTNLMFLICTYSQKRETILEAVRRMKELHREEGVKAFVLPIAASV